MQELIMQGMQQKWEKFCYRCKENTWPVESYYILQPLKYLIIAVNRFKYITNNFIQDMCPIPMDMTLVLGLHKFNLQAAIDYHGPSMYSGHYTTSVNCSINILLQRQQNYGVWSDWYQKVLYCLCGNVWIDYVMVFGPVQEDGSFDYFHGAGTSSPSY